jgi:hypothetical protein
MITPEIEKSINEKAKTELYKFFGHYANGTNSMYFELFAEGENVRVRKGVYNEVPQVDNVLSYMEAFKWFVMMNGLDYKLSFKATTLEDIEKGNRKRIEELQKDSINESLGLYYLSETETMTFQKFGDTFAITFFNGDYPVNVLTELQRPDAIAKLEELRNEGYVRELPKSETFSLDDLKNCLDF